MEEKQKPLTNDELIDRINEWANAYDVLKKKYDVAIKQAERLMTGKLEDEDKLSIKHLREIRDGVELPRIDKKVYHLIKIAGEKGEKIYCLGITKMLSTPELPMSNQTITNVCNRLVKRGHITYKKIGRMKFLYIKEKVGEKECTNGSSSES